jgi:mono/diheme cytochrome c family protein
MSEVIAVGLPASTDRPPGPLHTRRDRCRRVVMTIAMPRCQNGCFSCPPDRCACPSTHPLNQMRPSRRLLCLLALCLLLCLSAVRPVAAADDAIDFNEQIRPILSENCFHCHGPDAAAREADLRLDVRDAAIEWAIVPGKADESEVIRRITSTDATERMPPADSARSLSAEQIDLLTRWVAQGAEYQSHWSFISPTKPDLPAHADPPGPAWCRNEIDHFVLARLQQQGRHPSPEAAKETLLRRVTFDLTGLPPTLDEIDAFLADDSPQAYEAVVDRLLASPRYGERMTADWLDVARYSDTYGYQVDRDRFVWPWRDWVIRAFNDNLPYDMFLTRQLAGDLLPDATRDDILATTFNRLHPQKVEGGSVPEEFRIEYIADRTQTVATAFLGLTMECSRCHDHKYDPLSQSEYYQLSAFFDNIDEAGLYSYFTESIPTPTLLLPTLEQEQRIDELRQSVAQAEAQLVAARDARREAFEQWLAAARTDTRPAEPIAHLTFEEPPAAPNEQVEGRVGKAVRLTGDDAVNLEVGNFTRAQPFSVALWLQAPDVRERAVVFHRSRAWTDAASRGYELLIDEGRLSWSLIHFWPGNAISVRTCEPIPTGEWLHVAVTYDGSSRADGLRIFINGEAAEVETVRDGLTKQITGGGGDNIAIGERFRDRGFTDGLVDEFRVYDRRLSGLEVRQLHDDISLTAALQASVGELTPEQREQLQEFYLGSVDNEFAEVRGTLQEQRSQLNTLMDSVSEIMVMRELPQPKPSYLLLRGQYDARGEQVAPQTPAVLPPFPEDLPRNRLGLARWLTSLEHPLTSRVAVNRLWQMCFGNGLVTTPEDFGSQGRPPSHPLLLDWMAADFVENGWDVKRLLKQIVMSATYRQSSQVTDNFDPENRLLGRGPSYRLPAEMLRDNALAASGLLAGGIGGPPARPYEIEESFKPAARDKGEGLYRRSLYTYWKRTAPAPVMMTLDASTREVCRVNRERTASPLQLLALFNGPQYNEAARALAESLIREHGEDRDALLVSLFRRLITRRPTDAEVEVLAALYDQQIAAFGDDPQSATTLLSVGDSPRDESLEGPRVAAVMTVASALFNFDECVTKR